MNALVRSLALAAVALLAACQPYEGGKTPLGDLPTASFTVNMVDSNTVQLVSTATGSPFMYRWEVSNGTLAEGQEATVTLSRAGLRLVEVPVVIRQRQAGESTLSLGRTMIYSIKVSIAIALSLLHRRSGR